MAFAGRCKSSAAADDDKDGVVTRDRNHNSTFSDVTCHVVSRPVVPHTIFTLQR